MQKYVYDNRPVQLYDYKYDLNNMRANKNPK